jgi:ribonuclease HII
MKEEEIERLKNLKKFEENLYNEGNNLIIGIDEAGRGPLAGPVAVGAVVMKRDSMLEWVNDSKKVTARRREILYDKIIEDSLAWSVQLVSEKEIDEKNILNATKEGLTLAIKEIISKLGKKPDIVITDALREIDTCEIPYESIIKGDATCYSISCASILAKVTRDRIMEEWDKVYPEYEFAKHKGYGTKQHIEAIKKYGPCPIHRKTFITHFI